MSYDANDKSYMMKIIQHLKTKEGPNNYKILCLENAFKRLKRSSYKVDFNVTKQNKQNI
jgi:hypothetical protein